MQSFEQQLEIKFTMSTPRNRLRDTKTRLGRRNQVILPQDICDQVGVRAGDELRVSVVKRAKKVPKGSIVLSPDFFNTRPWTDEEWLEKEREVDASLARGETYGPFDNADDAIKFLKKESKLRRSRS